MRLPMDVRGCDRSRDEGCEEPREFRCRSLAGRDLRSDRAIIRTAVPRPQIARAESGDVDVRMSTVARMAAVLGKRLEWTLIDAG